MWVIIFFIFASVSRKRDLFPYWINCVQSHETDFEQSCFIWLYIRAYIGMKNWLLINIRRRFVLVIPRSSIIITKISLHRTFLTAARLTYCRVCLIILCLVLGFTIRGYKFWIPRAKVLWKGNQGETSFQQRLTNVYNNKTDRLTKGKTKIMSPYCK